MHAPTASHSRSFPFYSRRGFTRNIVNDAVDAPYFVDDAIRHLGQECMWQLSPLCGHEIGGLHSTQRNDIFVSSPVTHHANRTHGKEHDESLRRLLIPAGRAQLFDKYRIGVAQQIRIFRFYFAQDPHAEPRAGKRMPENHVMREAELESKVSHFILEQLAQWFQQL